MEERIAGLKAREVKNKKRNNQKFIVLALICCVYFLFPSGLVILSATLFLFWIFYSIKKQDRAQLNAFKEEQKPFTDQFSSYMKEHISGSGTVKAACGYLESAGDFQNVNVFAADGRLYVKRLLIQADFVYSINNVFWYLFSMSGVPEADLLEMEESAVCLETETENHQDFLRGRGIKWNRLEIMQGYIYDRFIPEILDKTLVGRIAMDSGIDSLRKEKIYSAKMSNGAILYLTGRAAKALGYTL